MSQINPYYTDLYYTLKDSDDQYDDSLATPVLALKIYNTGLRLPQPSSGLQYDDLDAGARNPIASVRLETRQSTVYLVFQWRSSSPELIDVTSGPTGWYIVPEIRNKTTSIAFPTPPTTADPASAWRVEGGSPGFDLRVRVKRKA